MPHLQYIILTSSVGAGHNGLATAAQLKSMGLDALVVDSQKRVGDNWRLRYRYVTPLVLSACSDFQILVAPRSRIRQPPPLHPIPSYLASLHPSWKARQLPRILRRDPRVKCLVSSHRRPQEDQVRPQDQHLECYHRPGAF